MIMKRILILIISSLLFAAGVFFFYKPLLVILENKDSIISFIVIMSTGLIFTISIYIFISYSSILRVRKLNERLGMWTKLSYHVNQVGDEIFNELPIGIIAYEDDEVKWANGYATIMFNGKVIEEDISDLNIELSELVKGGKEYGTIEINNEFYDVINKKDLDFLYLFNVTNREKIATKYENQIPAMGIIYLDNLDESMATLDVSEQSSIKGEYLSAIDDWLTKHNAYLKPYNEDRLVFLTYRTYLEDMMIEKFDILEKIRKISQDHEVRVSLSIGVASWDVSYNELGIYAQNAIDLAEKRGGDQVVVNIEHHKIEYFGAKLDASAKSSRVGARINSQTIRDYIKKSSKVFIMGHNQTDLDSYGSMLAMYHMAKYDKSDVYKVYDKEKLDATVIKVITEINENNPNILTDNLTTEETLKLMDDDSLLIVVDTQSEKIVISPEVLKAAKKVIVIDHHRVGDEGFDAVFSYIEPSASSAIELIMELYSFYEDEALKFSPQEASIMYGGLVLDTNNFTIRTGTRTFEVAHKLKELGADPGIVKMWLRRDLKRTLAINKFIGNLEVYMDRFAFMKSYIEQDDRIILAQTSEEALLIDGIEAAFTISPLGESIGVSARSTADINVQLIMEYIGGGGHLNSAAAQINGQSVDEVYENIKSYVAMEYNMEDEEMEVILLEDIKGRGKKDQVIKVAAGYGAFLIKQEKAIVANEENIAMLVAEKALIKQKEVDHLNLMKKLKGEIESKSVTIIIQTGQDGKLFGSVTTKGIAEEFQKQNGILLDRKKIELSSDINSVGIYTASVILHRDVRANFEINVIEKQ